MVIMNATNLDLEAMSEENAGCKPKVPAWKRLLDISSIVMAAPLWLPMCLLISLAIKVLSPGPVLFKQERVGFRGRRFWCLKFRTMAVHAETHLHEQHFKELLASGRPMNKLDKAGDKRLIRGGRLLRVLGLDELPQLLNVLRGEMSLVGPRPSLAYECELYRSRDWRRFATLPGLTGLWQVCGKNRTTFDQMIDLDLRYVDSKSVLLDISILMRTPSAILNQVLETKRARKRPALAPCA
jgi:lipopolysaccharide/colanic/teichoic acid biosynthesis glycosyltransferase